MADKAVGWINFLRKYGPIARNDNMYDEHIRKSSKRLGIRPIEFTHPVENDVLSLFRQDAPLCCSVILTGTAGDGKSNLCGRVWQQLGGDETEWSSDDIYYRKTALVGGKTVTVHLIRDLTALPRLDEKNRYVDRQQLLELFCQSVFNRDSHDIFLIAANDGQLVESWQRLGETDLISRTRALFESFLVEDLLEKPDVSLRFFNLSRTNSAVLLDLVLNALLSHEGWLDCYRQDAGEFEFFGTGCPIRHNYELLKIPLLQSRLRALFELCEYNDLHIPIRRILLLLSNAILGHPDVKDRLMRPADIPDIIKRGTVSKASLFNNIFGGNLFDTRREALEVFQNLNKLRIGYETSNRIDNTLIYGHADENLKPYFDQFLASDSFYGANESYYAAQHEYLEGTDEDNSNSQAFLELLVSQRRGLFFKVPEDQEQEMTLWELTVFKYAGEYLTRLMKVLKAGGKIERPILSRLVRGLNRVFVGMLVSSDREIILAKGLSYTDAKVCPLLEERVSVIPRLGEKVEVILINSRPVLRLSLSAEIFCDLPLNLTRYEFLSRVAEGALPSSFSKECYEDMLAYKSKVLRALAERPVDAPGMTFRLLSVDEHGNPAEEIIEVAND